MIWIALAAMFAVVWWNTHRYTKYLDNIEAAVKRRIEKFDSQLDEVQAAAKSTTKLSSEIENMGNRTAVLEGHVRALLDRPEYRSHEASRAALKDILRR